MRQSSSIKFWQRVFSEVIAEYICNHPEMSIQEVKGNLYKSPETEAGQIWNAIILKTTTTTWKKNQEAASVPEQVGPQLDANAAILQQH